MRTESQPELFLIGLGMMIPDHITIQAMQAMSSCAQLYTIVQEPAQMWLPSGSSRQIDVINALEWYVDGRLRTQNYEYVAKTILRSAHIGHSIGYVTYGNPMTYDRVAQNLLNYAKEKGFSVRVVPGISSIDTVLCDLGVDIAPGTQVFEASWFVAYEIAPRVDVPLLLLQVGSFGSLRTHYTTRQDGSSLAELVEYLRRFYPKSHQVSLVRSTNDSHQPFKIRSVAAGDLCEVTAEDLGGASLYVPAQHRPLPNSAALERMTAT